ncbi:hypothetical protein [Pontibacter sp. G13]|uniref:hypothetical protein n=1 Tax=Pontibacter sp. G13 TaxID=3074898 RepID=UPI00288BAE30|nr:hypothetical protein [Pontibacter sp. G13]WNJ16899.1 hypothetical protein RJD25_18705 [Pontibacter sp. G13]
MEVKFPISAFISSLLFTFTCCLSSGEALGQENPVYFQSFSIGMSYSHQPKWGPIRPMAGFSQLYLSHKSIHLKYQRLLKKNQWQMEAQYTLSGFNEIGRLREGGIPPEAPQIGLIERGVYPKYSVNHQLAYLIGKHTPLYPQQNQQFGWNAGPILRLGFDHFEWEFGTYDLVLERRYAFDWGLSGQIFFRWLPIRRLALVLSAQFDQYLYARRQSNVRSSVEVSRNTAHIGMNIEYRFGQS